MYNLNLFPHIHCWPHKQIKPKGKLLPKIQFLRLCTYKKVHCEQLVLPFYRNLTFLPHTGRSSKVKELGQPAVLRYYFFCFLKILKVCFLRLAVESVSSPVEPLSSSKGLFLYDSCGMRLPFPPGCPPPVGDGVSGSVELRLTEREDSVRLFISPRLGDFCRLCMFFTRMGLSSISSMGLDSWIRFPPLGVWLCSDIVSSPRPGKPCTKEVGLIKWPLEL